MTLRSSRLFLVLPLLTACGSSQPAPTQPTPDTTIAAAPLGPTTPPPMVDAGIADAAVASAPDSNSGPAFASSINAFNADVYGKLKSGIGNIFYSPTSIEIALAMAAAGAHGTTATQMQQVLHLSANTTSSNAGASQLLSSWSKASDSAPTLTIANRLWGQKDYVFTPDYLQTTRDSFEAELGQVDYKSAAEQARSAINTWVADKTNQKILNLIPAGALTKATRLVLTNAVYFKGTWVTAFDKSATKNAPFKTDANSVSVPTMHHEFTRASYIDNAHAQIISLPYKGDAAHSLSMIIALPKSGTTLAAVESDLAATSVSDWAQKMSFSSVNVSLPRFKTSSQFELGNTLKQMGMPLAFTDQADFTRMAQSTTEPLQISNVIHKAYVDVNEEGTEAAAATGVVMTARAAMVSAPPIEFKVDHPFVFFIRDNNSGAILFAGRIADPTK